MPKISMEQQQRGQTVILSFTIAGPLNDETHSNTEPMNVNDMALVQFKFRHVGGSGKAFYELESSILFKKIASAMSSSSTVKIKVTCGNFDKENSKEWDCTDNWDERELLSKKRNFNENGALFSTLDVKLTVYETKMSPPLTHKLYEDEELTDFALTAADGNVAIHKTLLVMHSEVFMMMFKREWKETLTGEIAIKGVTKQTLQDLKQYIYLGTLPDEGLEPLLVIAARYMMDELEAHCIAKLVQSATPEKLDDLIDFACLNNLPDLMRAVLFEHSDPVMARLSKLKMSMGKAKDENK